ncbi:energy transducer TonB [Pseudomonas sp. KNUC1026]|uniref:energy transducer TonB n=1 Tax=Pseudomonas sp. KNUC1026 TaxID=2893890 RepID=UPI001F2AE9D8|nr:energy transducer TonB [Pseudomonas sp. KNUC1026]UFH48704.1 energy transducer TonB [Pseudomonas sp. KNUC1026]
MLTEPRRRAYLDAMQIVQWLPRAELPFAAPSRPELFIELEPEPESEVQPEPAIAAVARLPVETPRPKVAKLEIPRPAPAQPKAKAKAEEPAKASEPAAAPVPPPRFALQLLRAGRCLLLVELPTGEAFQSRDPAYLLLKDMLRAAGLPDSPKMVGDPVRWPLLTRGNLDQGPQAATDFVQGFVAAQTEREPCTCLWLVGLPALRFGGASDADGYQRHWQVEGLGDAWGVPGLELLMDEPQRKAAVWQSMRALMPRWITPE